MRLSFHPPIAQTHIFKVWMNKYIFAKAQAFHSKPDPHCFTQHLFFMPHESLLHMVCQGTEANGAQGIALDSSH